MENQCIEDKLNSYRVKTFRELTTLVWRIADRYAYYELIMREIENGFSILEAENQVNKIFAIRSFEDFLNFESEKLGILES